MTPAGKRHAIVLALDRCRFGRAAAKSETLAGILDRCVGRTDMPVSRCVGRSLLLLGLWAIAGCAVGEAPSTQVQFEPTVGQAGKDVVWVPTPQALAEKMLDMAKVTPADFVIDLGSGDGRTVIAAAQRGARAIGIEYNPKMVELSKRNAAAAGVVDKATFAQADLFESDFSRATVITMFLMPGINLRLRPIFLKLKPGTRLVSNTFPMGEWIADETETMTDNCEGYCTALLWIVPARVEGTWRFPQGQLALKQDFQMVSGSLTSSRSTTPIAEGRLRGDQISFRVDGAQYAGRVDTNTIQGTVTAGGDKSSWSASRTSP
jgi:precorrin-6B methylase 2